MQCPEQLRLEQFYESASALGATLYAGTGWRNLLG
jgi:hypothetical protein